jgi:hypothetical protein
MYNIVGSLKNGAGAGSSDAAGGIAGTQEPTENEVRLLADEVAAYDANGDGRLTFPELQALMRATGEEIDEATFMVIARGGGGGDATAPGQGHLPPAGGVDAATVPATTAATGIAKNTKPVGTNATGSMVPLAAAGLNADGRIGSFHFAPADLTNAGVVTRYTAADTADPGLITNAIVHYHPTLGSAALQPPSPSASMNIRPLTVATTTVSTLDLLRTLFPSYGDARLAAMLQQVRTATPPSSDDDLSDGEDGRCAEGSHRDGTGGRRESSDVLVANAGAANAAAAVNEQQQQGGFQQQTAPQQQQGNERAAVDAQPLAPEVGGGAPNQPSRVSAAYGHFIAFAE